MAEIHSPDIYGPVELAGDPGVAGQVLTSAGPAAQAVWGTVSPGSFEFTSASSISHTIVHGLGNQFPAVTVYDTATNSTIIPATIVGTDANTLTITFAVPVAIAGTVVG